MMMNRFPLSTFISTIVVVVVVSQVSTQTVAFSIHGIRTRSATQQQAVSFSSQLAQLSPSRTTTTTTTRFLVVGDDDDNSNNDFEGLSTDNDEYTGSIDWDAEWKKVVQTEGKLDGGKVRPGSDYYKSEAEIAAIKTANAASKKVAEATSNVSSSLPELRSLSGDWRFWIAILAFVSVGLSLLTAPANVATGLQGDSYYI